VWAKRTREGTELYVEMSEAGVIDQKGSQQSKVALVYGHDERATGARSFFGRGSGPLRIAMTDYFRDEKIRTCFCYR